MTSTRHADTSKAVGVPVAESELTSALQEQTGSILAPGRGRSLVLLWEVDLGIGRPDALLLSLSLSGLRARSRAGLRLPSAAHARMLAAIEARRSTGFSSGHERQLTAELRANGWTTHAKRVRGVSNLVWNSLVIEAKMSDWRGGIFQLARVRWAAHSAALLMPNETQHRASRKALRHNRLGLFVYRDSTIVGQIEPPAAPLSRMADLWLTELAIRSVAIPTD